MRSRTTTTTPHIVHFLSFIDFYSASFFFFFLFGLNMKYGIAHTQNAGCSVFDNVITSLQFDQRQQQQWNNSTTNSENQYQKCAVFFLFTSLCCCSFTDFICLSRNCTLPKDVYQMRGDSRKKNYNSKLCRFSSSSSSFTREHLDECSLSHSLWFCCFLVATALCTSFFTASFRHSSLSQSSCAHVCLFTYVDGGCDHVKKAHATIPTRWNMWET